MHCWNPECKSFMLSHFERAGCVGQYCLRVHTKVRISLVKYCKGPLKAPLGRKGLSTRPLLPAPALWSTLQHRCLHLRPHIRRPSSFSSTPPPISVALLRRRCVAATNITTPPPPPPSASSVVWYFATMAANRGMVEASMEAAGFCVNSRGGAYKNGKA